MLGSGRALAAEVRGCFETIKEIGRGVVYFGSARFEPGSKLYEEGKALSTRVAKLLKVPAWSGGGKGMMGAVTHGTKAGGMPVGAVRISREASDAPGKAPPGKNAMHAVTCFCQFMASRKIGLTDAGMRVREADRTAFIALPGGIGTLDEVVEILVLGQLNKLGTNFPIPVILMNYDGYWDGLMSWITDAERLGALKTAEIDNLKVFGSNDACIKYLSDFYGVKE
jgi:predicted Rossmann-fold nucleotide-binding protein